MQFKNLLQEHLHVMQTVAWLTTHKPGRVQLTYSIDNYS